MKTIIAAYSGVLRGTDECGLHGRIGTLMEFGFADLHVPVSACKGTDAGLHGPCRLPMMEAAIQHLWRSQGWGRLALRLLEGLSGEELAFRFSLKLRGAGSPTSFFLLPAGTGSSILSALQDLSWLSKSQVEKQLQSISVLQWVLSFLAMGVVSTIILMYMLCTDCWVIAAVYLAWLAFDWNTPKTGGRRSQWVRNWAVWRYFRDYFPVRLVKTHNLLTNRNYIFGYHPHGIMGLGAFCNFGTEATGVGQKFPGIRPYLATLAGNFRMPILRDYLMSGGICPVNRDSMNYILSRNGTGNAIVIVVGGAAESLNCTPGKNSVTLRHRKGFVKLALQHGADLVPIYSFGENEVYRQVIFEEGSWGRWVQKKFQKYVGFAPCVFHGQGLFSSNSWGLLPYPKPITTVVGEPITVPKIDNPSQKEVDFYHSLYVSSLIKLFDKYKTKFGLPETDTLEIN
ncbi:Diacylglycerol O-acyltransferase 2 [Varanus komodoensis]|nr:Diacylglycerol O-acyltransferase 2 [Varanus komodoensis]